MTAQENARRALDTLESLMETAWPPLEGTPLEGASAGGWLFRSAGGVTQRANSIRPLADVSDPGASLRHAEKWYAEHRQPVIFQLTHRPENDGLEDFLDSHGYSRQSETLIMTAAPSAVFSASGPSTGITALPSGVTVELADTPSEDWLELWWSVDGRGGSEEKQVARRILAGAPSIYATARHAAGDVVGTGRLILASGWGGVYCMATHPDARRQGVAASLLQVLSEQAAAMGAARLWLMVTAVNIGAQALYTGAGFVEAGRYHYRQAPLRRAPTAC